jgi:hypothetical protein
MEHQLKVIRNSQSITGGHAADCTTHDHHGTIYATRSEAVAEYRTRHVADGLSWRTDRWEPTDTAPDRRTA